MRIILCLVSMLMSFNLLASPIGGEKYLLKYQDGAHYEVSFTNTHVTWKGVKGPEAGRYETDKYVVKVVATQVYAVAWTENDGTKVDLVLEVARKKVSAVVVFGEERIQKNGSLEKIAPLSSYCPSSSVLSCKNKLEGSTCSEDGRPGNCRFAPLTAGDFCLCGTRSEPDTDGPCAEPPFPRHCKE